MSEPTPGDPPPSETTGPTSSSVPPPSSSSAPPPSSSSNPPPPPPSSSSTPPSSSSAPPSSSSRASSTEEESTTPPASTEPTTVREPDNPSTLTTESSVVVTDPATVTRFSTITSNRPGVSPTSIADDGKSNSFFDNKGAVAGVFSVVGLIVLAILFALFFTAIRRRRAKKFDREIEAAAREAAAAQPPAGFLDDDDDAEGRYNRGYSNGSGGGVGAVGGYGGGGGGGYGAYSDVSSHGTYNQPALSHHNTGSAGAPTAESYNMREIDSSATPSRHMSVSPGEVFDYTSASGAAGIGVARARSMKGANANYGQALQDGSTPYAAFSAPPMPSTSPGPHGANGVNRRNTGGYESSRGMDILEAAGMGAHLSGVGRQSQQFGGGGGLERNKSLNSSVSQYSNNSGGSQGYADYPPPPPMPSHQPHQGGYNDYPAYQQGGRQQQQAIEEDDGDDDAYGGYVVDEPSANALGKQKARESLGGGGQMPNPFDAAGHLQHQQLQQGYPETPDVSEGPRVLKVANE